VHIVVTALVVLWCAGRFMVREIKGYYDNGCQDVGNMSLSTVQKQQSHSLQMTQSQNAHRSVESPCCIGHNSK
jgi:hypothetical protein